ncbi:MAG: PH domain-containing protein [Acidobacteriota bacterium]|jgi:uncharacterized membrane protein YdbT with pleckstrin-like domain
MSYVDKNLLQGEAVAYRARLHWMIFALPFLIAVLGAVLAWLAHSWYVAALGFGLAFLTAIPRFIRYATSEFAVTNKRVVFKVGLINRHTLELVLAKLETIGVEQNIPGRIFNYGTIIVTGTGGTKEPFREIADPLEFRKHVQSQLA